MDNAFLPHTLGRAQAKLTLLDKSPFSADNCQILIRIVA
jgi:hypothetical protein